MQKLHKQKSAERCTYVGYPGKFNKDVYRSSFRKKVKLQRETPVEWAGPESIVCSVDGQSLDGNIRRYTLKPGTHTLVFDVSSADRLPCLIVKGDGVSDLKGWQVSLDNEAWNDAETDARYNKPSVKPDAEQEIVTRIQPEHYILLRNASERSGKLELGKNGRLVVDFRHSEVGNVRLNVTGTGSLSFFVGERRSLERQPDRFRAEAASFLPADRVNAGDRPSGSGPALSADRERATLLDYVALFRCESMACGVPDAVRM